MEGILTIIITGVTVLVSYMAFKDPAMRMRFMMIPYNVSHLKEYKRIITHAFIHKDGMHLLINMFVFYQFGQLLETALISENTSIFSYFPYSDGTVGYVYYFMIYFGGAVFASLPSMIKHKDNPHYMSLGASGAVASILFALIVIAPTSEIALFFFIPLDFWVFGVLYLFYEWYMGKRGGTGIAHDAHFFGAVWGLIVMLTLSPKLYLRCFEMINSSMADLLAAL